ncbi:acetyl-CoA sensor PanZ family protein [Agarivorans gilvus]|uniref:N-acetyltransferase domain-containing protein n=1 Tax=Agarivorans gilvus TaxID=680279 RepID=A0ABQ1I3S1_9ALTE|nr:acetyl-CoA sensor PanZ family protein [Agarivorans gilvus]GGB07284.1 hypothetical protein GCM10007414_20760 [Agarivorans gilvus]
MRLSFQAASAWPKHAADLSKIAPSVNEQQWQQWQQAGQLYYCVFNQRVVAYCVVESHFPQLTIRRFAVRDITRRRGIGLYMFQQLLQLSAQRQLSRLAFPASNQAATLSFYNHLGLNNQQVFEL